MADTGSDARFFISACATRRRFRWPTRRRCRHPLRVRERPVQRLMLDVPRTALFEKPNAAERGDRGAGPAGQGDRGGRASSQRRACSTSSNTFIGRAATAAAPGRRAMRWAAPAPATTASAPTVPGACSPHAHDYRPHVVVRIATCARVPSSNCSVGQCVRSFRRHRKMRWRLLIVMSSSATTSYWVRLRQLRSSSSSPSMTAGLLPTSAGPLRFAEDS